MLHSPVHVFLLVLFSILLVHGDTVAGGPQAAPSSLSPWNTETLYSTISDYSTTTGPYGPVTVLSMVSTGMTTLYTSFGADAGVPASTTSSTSFAGVPSCLNFCLNGAGATQGASTSLCQNTDFGGNVEQCADSKCSDDSWTDDFSSWETSFCSLSAAAASTSSTAAASSSTSSSSSTMPSSTLQSTTTSSTVATTSTSSTDSSSSSSTSTSTSTSASPPSSTSISTSTPPTPMPNNPTSSPTASPIPSSELSTDAKAGIGVGAAVGGLLILALFMFLMWRHAKKSRKQHQEEDAAKESQSQIWRNSEFGSDVPPTYEEKGKGKEATGPAELPSSDWRHSGRSELDTYGPKALTPGELDDLMRNARTNGGADNRESGVSILRRYQQAGLSEGQQQPPGELDAMVRRVRLSGAGEAHQDRDDGDRYYAGRPGTPRHL